MHESIISHIIKAYSCYPLEKLRSDILNVIKFWFRLGALILRCFDVLIRVNISICISYLR